MYPTQPQPVPGSGSNGMALAAMIVGIASLLGGCCIGIPGGGVAIILGLLGMKKANVAGTGKGMAMAGIICGAVALLVGIVFFILWIIGMASGQHSGSYQRGY